MKRSVLFVTGTDTGVGKTVLAAVLTRHLRERGVKIAALKPVCSGGRHDARALRAAAGHALPLDEINPWHFHAPLSPLLAARLERRRVTLPQVVTRVRAMARRFELVVVEGAGGLLSPLGEVFDSRDLITALRATPIVVCPNRLGALHQVLLTLEALPRAIAKRTQIVLMNPPRLDLAARTNPELLAEIIGRLHGLSIANWAREQAGHYRERRHPAGEVLFPEPCNTPAGCRRSQCGFVGHERIHALGWLGENPFSAAAGKRPAIRKALDRLVCAVGGEEG